MTRETSANLPSATEAPEPAAEQDIDPAPGDGAGPSYALADPPAEAPSEPGTQVLQDGQGRRVVRTWRQDPERGWWCYEHRYPDVLTHLYAPAAPGEPIALYAGAFRLSSDSDGAEFTGEAAMHWYPNPHIVASGRLDQVTDDALDFLTRDEPPGWTETPHLIAVDGDVPAPPAVMFEDPFTSGAGAIRTQTDISQQCGTPTDLDRITFLLPNGSDTWSRQGVTDPAMPQGWWNGYFSCEAGDWRITLHAARRGTADLVKKLKVTGQSAATHIGQLERTDGARFDVADAVVPLEMLRRAMCLVEGRYTALLLPVGWQGDTPRWTAWRSARIGALTGPGLLDGYSGYEQLTEIIRCFIDYGTTEHRRTILERVVGQYLASTRDAESQFRIAAAVSGLELLAYHVHVEEQRSPALTKTAWSKEPTKSTEAHIRHLLDAASVPTVVPARYAELAKAAVASLDAAGQARDALGVVVKIRNEATHPVTSMGLDGLQWWEAGAWSNEALLLGLLFAIGYTGTYRSASRGSGWYGDSTAVPWAPTPTP